LLYLKTPKAVTKTYPDIIYDFDFRGAWGTSRIVRLRGPGMEGRRSACLISTIVTKR
jgi:hypothetical protein